MDWKEFLRPTRRKIFLAILLNLFFLFIVPFLIIFIFQGSVEYRILNIFERIPYSNTINYTIVIYLGITFFYYKMGEKLSERILSILLIFFLSGGYWYLVSCLIFWIYDKVRKK